MSTTADQLWEYVEIWHRACGDFIAVGRGLSSDEGELPTDLEGWSVRDNIAHTGHLEAVLAGAPEDTGEVEPGPHVKNLAGHYTEIGVMARRERDLAELLDELEHAVDQRYAALQADPPTDPVAPPSKTPGDVPWNTQTLLSNRPLDVWMHEQDIRRAVGRPGGFDGPPAAHVIDVFGRGLAFVLGKKVGASPGTSVSVVVPDAGRHWTVQVGPDGRAGTAGVAEPTTRIALDAEPFIILAGGRRAPDRVEARVEGDTGLGERFLANLAMTP